MTLKISALGFKLVISRATKNYLQIDMIEALQHFTICSEQGSFIVYLRTKLYFRDTLQLCTIFELEAQLQKYCTLKLHIQLFFVANHVKNVYKNNFQFSTQVNQWKNYIQGQKYFCFTIYGWSHGVLYISNRYFKFLFKNLANSNVLRFKNHKSGKTIKTF